MAEEKSLIDEVEDTRYLCRYQATIIFILDDTQFTLQPENILSIEKVDNFDFDIRSMIKLKLHLDTRKVTWLMRNKEKVKCKFELVAIRQVTDGEQDLSGEATVWNSLFNIFFSENDISVNVAATEESSESNGETQPNDLDNESYWDRSIIDLFLLESKSLKSAKKKVNRVFTSENLQNIIAKICNDAGQNNVYMSRLDNQTTFSNFCVPEFPLEKALAYLDLYYGFYTSGAQIYYDVDKLFILKANGKVTAKVKDEWAETVFLITGRNLAIPGNGMVIKPEQKIYYINITDESITSQDLSLNDSISGGSTIKVLINNDGSTQTVKSGTDSVGVETIRYVRNDENPYIVSMMNARMDENTCIEKITVENADIRAFALNKSIKLVFEEPEKQKLYGSNRYRLAYADHLIKAESDQYMACKSRLVLKKCSDA